MHDPPAKKSPARGLSRRHFLTTAGIGAVGASLGATPVVPAEPHARVLPASETIPVNLTVNGRRHRVLAEPRWSLLHVLRETIGLTGTKVGCDRGECGACTVLIDDQPRYSCLTLAVEAADREITTVEGLLEGEQLGAVQRAFVEHDAYQCGYCTPGQIMAVEGLLRSNADPSLEQIRVGTSGNLCRCGAYPNICRAVTRAAEIKREGSTS